jgi:hypothetical protein
MVDSQQWETDGEDATLADLARHLQLAALPFNNAATDS